MIDSRRLLFIYTDSVLTYPLQSIVPIVFKQLSHCLFLDPGLFSCAHAPSSQSLLHVFSFHVFSFSSSPFLLFSFSSSRLLLLHVFAFFAFFASPSSSSSPLHLRHLLPLRLSSMLLLVSFD